VAAAGKTPLLLDATDTRVTDMYFMCTRRAAPPPSAPPAFPAGLSVRACGGCAADSEATVVEAKKVVTDVRMAGTTVEAAREGLRTQLVHAMRWGHLLVVRMANSAAVRARPPPTPRRRARRPARRSESRRRAAQSSGCLAPPPGLLRLLLQS
jgi:hypothetical protein